MIEKIRKAIKYNPDTGVFTRLTGATNHAYMHPNATGAPRISVLGKEYSCRTLAWWIMTGEYPGKHEIISRDGDLSNVKWSNLYKVKQGYKRCSKCKEEKELGAFARKRTECRVCTLPKNKELERSYRLRNKFGITPEQYDTLVAIQQSGCAICGGIDSNKALAVDHCHTTGKVRGLLCSRCNQGLGMFKDSPALLEKAKVYVTP